MGTSYDLKLVPAPGQMVSTDLKTRVEALLAGINKVMSTYDPNSELSRFNQNSSTDWITVSPELGQVVSEGLQISELSGGAFDITVGPLVNLWGFGPEPRRAATIASIFAPSAWAGGVSTSSPGSSSVVS